MQYYRNSVVAALASALVIFLTTIGDGLFAFPRVQNVVSNGHMTQTACVIEPSDNSGEDVSAFKQKSRFYFRMAIGPSYGEYRYVEKWDASSRWMEGIDRYEPTGQSIGRYRGVGAEATIDLGKRVNPLLALGYYFQVGAFPELKLYKQNKIDVNALHSVTQKAYVANGFFLTVYPWRSQGGFYASFRIGAGILSKIDYYKPWPRLNIGAAMGYAFVRCDTVHLGVQASFNTISAKGHLDGDYTIYDSEGRILSFLIGLTVSR